MKPAPATTAAAALIALTIAAAPNPAVAQCEGGKWSETFPAPNFFEGAEVLRIKALDLDGPGPLEPQLVFTGIGMIGSGFFEGHPFPTTDVQVWDGRHLRPVGDANFISGTVRDVAMFDEDDAGPAAPTLYCAGHFFNPGSGRVARLRGGAWEVVPGIQNTGTPRVLQPFDPDGDGPMPQRLLLGGTVQLTGEASSIGVASWDGSTWTALSAGFAPTAVNRLLAGPPSGPSGTPQQLFAAGSRNDNGTLTHGVFSWDGESWSQLGPAFSAAPLALIFFDDDGPEGPNPERLVVGGGFAPIGGTSPQFLAAWHGVAWTAMANQLPAGFVLDLVAFDSDGEGPLPRRLFAARNTGGESSSQSVYPVTGPAGPDPTPCNLFTWASGRVGTLCVFDVDGPGPMTERLIVGGEVFATIQTPSTLLLSNITGALTWDGCQWSYMPRQIEGDPMFYPPGFLVEHLAVLPGEGPTAPDRLIVAGSFFSAGGVPARNIASWNGEEFEPMGGELFRRVHDIAVFDFDDDGPEPLSVIAAGRVPDAAPNAFRNVISKWTGAAWIELGPGFLSSIVLDLHVAAPYPNGPSSPVLYALGSTQTSSERTIAVFRWEDDHWSQVGPALEQSPLYGTGRLISLPSVNGSAGHRLVVASYNSITTPGIERCPFLEWDGSEWARVEATPTICDWPVYEIDGLSITAVPAETEASGGAPAFLFAPFYFGTSSSVPAEIVRVVNGTSSIAILPVPANPNHPPHSQPYSAVSGLTVFDADGRGPRLPAVYAGLTDRRRIGVPSLWTFQSGAWHSLDERTAYAVPHDFASFDYDGEGPRPPSLMVAHDGSRVLLGSPEVIPAVGFLREWIPTVPATLIESPHSLIVRPGDSASFKVLAVGTDASIAWRKDTAPLPEGALATEHSWIIAIDSATTDDRGLYDAVITNDCAEVTSAQAELRVRVLEGDANADTVVDFADITNALANWGNDYKGATGPGDADSDGAVTMSDLTATLKNWLAREE